MQCAPRSIQPIHPTTHQPNNPSTHTIKKHRARDSSGDLAEWGIKEAWHGPKFTLILRTENTGMDLGAHNATLEYFSFKGLLGWVCAPVGWGAAGGPRMLLGCSGLALSLFNQQQTSAWVPCNQPHTHTQHTQLTT